MWNSKRKTYVIFLPYSLEEAGVSLSDKVTQTVGRFSHSNYSNLKCAILTQVCVYGPSESLTVTVPMLALTWLILAASDVEEVLEWTSLLRKVRALTCYYTVCTHDEVSVTKDHVQALNTWKSTSVGTLRGLGRVYVLRVLDIWVGSVEYERGYEIRCVLLYSAWCHYDRKCVVVSYNLIGWLTNCRWLQSPLMNPILFSGETVLVIGVRFELSAFVVGYRSYGILLPVPVFPTDSIVFLSCVCCPSMFFSINPRKAISSPWHPAKSVSVQPYLPLIFVS